MNILGINVEFEKLESTKDVDYAQAATATLHTDWLDISFVDLSVQKGLSNLFSSSRAQKVKLENEKNLKEQESFKAFEKYSKQGEPRDSDHQADLIQICQI